MKRIKFFNLFCLVVLYLVSLSGCKKKDDSNAPVLPPSTSMNMDGLSTFGSKKKSAFVVSDSSNFLKAWKFVHTWDSIATKFVLVPKLIFKEALTGKDPVYDNVNEEWTWTYVTKEIAGNGNFQAILKGKVSSDSVYWTMTVSLIGGDGISNFKWYEGQTDLKQTGGWWKLYEPVSKKANLLINWSKESDAVRWIQYTNILETATEKGKYIKYGLTSATDYNAYFDISRGVSENSAKIEWNTATCAGRIICAGWILDWDSTLKSLDPVKDN